MARLLIKNIGKMVSGDIRNPLIDADALLVEDGKIARIGKGEELEVSAEKVIDAKGITLTPGLIDSHFHPVLGDFTPRQSQFGFIESALHGGVTTMISAGEVHLPGRPRDVAGTKALAILAAKSWANLRPGGVKVLGGGLILEKGLKEKDFEELAAEGVTHVGEIGLGSVNQPEEAAPMVRWAKKNGMTVMMHTGGTSIPGSTTVTAEEVIATAPDVIAHLNGGPTAVFPEEVDKLIKKTPLAFEIVHCGNPKIALQIIKTAKEAGAFHRILIGNDAPSGTGVIPLGILRVLNLICSLGRVKAEEAIAMATGNTARIYKLNRGIIREGLEADLVLMDAPMGSVGEDALQAIEAGDIPGISFVIIDGQLRITASRNTPPPKQKAIVEA
ncbi:MAG: amidohydrolase family protein [Dehalococcoidia bacterium]|nr:amidohydrolase family protein [Dehalococcoidia bacterium]